jgi:Protein of unknown function (DUF992)
LHGRRFSKTCGKEIHERACFIADLNTCSRLVEPLPLWAVNLHHDRRTKMTMKSTFLICAVACSAAFLPSAGQAQDTLKVGTLSCNVSAGLGLIVTSSRDMNCQFRPSRGGRESYRGTIRRFGLDIGATTRGVLVWTVVAQTRRPTRGALAGDYTGGAAEATVGIGLGVNVLVGGSERAYSLQPVSVEGQLGLNLAAGVAQLTLVRSKS